MKGTGKDKLRNEQKHMGEIHNAWESGGAAAKGGKSKGRERLLHQTCESCEWFLPEVQQMGAETGFDRVSSISLHRKEHGHEGTEVSSHSGDISLYAAC